MNRLQENTVERLSLERGNLAIREGYADKHVEAAERWGALWLIAEDGTPTRSRSGDFSVDWSAEDYVEPAAGCVSLEEALLTIARTEAECR